ncbi:MAG: hypothetical protein K2X06_12375 [Burkholderiales bacterium]|nr:hypothetical protein [Burkholderiales bacterium]
MNISEFPVSQDTLRGIAACAQQAATIVGVDLAQSSPAQIIEAVDSFLYRWQKGQCPKLDEDDDLSLILGSLWGEQLVRGDGWEWAVAQFNEQGDSKAVGVFSPDRSIAVYPFDFVRACIENNIPVTILLAYNMLKDGKSIPKLPDKGYENVMNGIHHIVPRD